jgi:hypothetical protein
MNPVHLKINKEYEAMKWEQSNAKLHAVFESKCMILYESACFFF